MIASTAEKINGSPIGLDTDLLYLSDSLASHFELDQTIAERIDKFLTTPRRSGEKPSGIRIGKHILVHLNVWLQTYSLVTQSIERSAVER